MMKKIATILCIITLMFSIGTEIEVKAEQTEPVYNNEEKVTHITNINAKELYTYPGNCFWGSWEPNYSREYIIQRMGAEPYWRRGKEDIDYGIYKTDTTHYLIVTSYGDSFSDRWYVSKIPSKELFEKYVQIGTTMDVVKLIDPDTININEGTTFTDYALSYHRFADRTFGEIHYKKNSDGEFVVERIDYKEEDILVVANLLDIDYQLIKNDNPNEEAEFLEKLKKLNEEPQDNPVVTPVKKKTAKVKIKSAKRIKKKSIRIKFQKAKNAKKYQIQYALNRKFKKAKIRTTKKTNCIIKTATAKTYYVRVRGVNGTKKGAWSKIKKVKSINK